MRGLLQHWTESFIIPTSKEGSAWRNKRPKKRTVSFVEDRLLTSSTITSGSLEPTILSRIMPTHSLLVFEMTIFRNSGIFKDVRFYPILNFGHFWAPLFSRCFYPIMNFGHFWALPFFKMSGFYPTRNFGQFWADLHFFSCQRHFFGRRGSPKSWIFAPPEILAIFGPPSQRCPAGSVATQCPLSLVSSEMNNKERHWRTNNIVRVFWWKRRRPKAGDVFTKTRLMPV